MSSPTDINFFSSRTRETGTSFLIDKFKYKIGCEVGVREGFFTSHLLSTPLNLVYGIECDPQRHYMIPLQKSHPHRFKLIEGRSPEVAQQFNDGFFDLIYIDAGHSYKDVKADLNGWWPKLRVGGLFIGDDYHNETQGSEGPYGVIPAVNEFVQQYNQKLFVSGLKSEANEFDKFLEWSNVQMEKCHNRARDAMNVQWNLIKREN